MNESAQVPLLAARGVSKHFGRRRVLDEVDLTVRAGEVVAVIGANGSGKSTLLGICAGQIKPDAGTIEIRGTIGLCPQHGGVADGLRADEQFVLFGAGRGRSRHAARAEGRALAATLDWEPPTVVAAKLSGGTRQKLNVVIAAIGTPDILLLDEPYQGFDHGTYVEFWEQVWRWRAEGRAVVVVTHLLHELERVDAVVELGRGKTGAVPS